MPNLSVLARAQVKREIFDPANDAHLASMKIFLSTGNWGSVQFYAELPYIEVPMTVMRKFCEYTLQIERETEKARAERFSTMNLVKPTPEAEAKPQ